MNDYKHVFGLNSKQDINRFIYDFLDFGKFYRIFKFYPTEHTDFVNKIKLNNKSIINKFIDDFTQADMVDEAYKIALRKWEEKEMGLDVFREEHERSMLKMEEERLKRQFDKRLN